MKRGAYLGAWLRFTLGPGRFVAVARGSNALAHSPFVAVPGLEPFLAAPVGDLVLVGRTFAFWQSSRRVHGTLMWGRPNEDDVAAMSDIWDAHMRSPFGRDPTLTDIRHLDGLDLLAFERLVTTRERRGEWTARTGPQAIVHSGGLAVAAILGAIQLTGSGYQLAAFDKPAPALAWLARPEFEQAYLDLRASLLGLPDIVRRVRAAIDASELRSTRAIARALGLSVRSLQRHLADAGTSLRVERTRQLIQRAERLLEGTDLDMDAIAAMLGLGSAARLMSLFRSVHGMTPGTFRAERLGEMRRENQVRQRDLSGRRRADDARRAARGAWPRRRTLIPLAGRLVLHCLLLPLLAVVHLLEVLTGCLVTEQLPAEPWNRHQHLLTVGSRDVSRTDGGPPICLHGVRERIEAALHPALGHQGIRCAAEHEHGRFDFGVDLLPGSAARL